MRILVVVSFLLFSSTLLAESLKIGVLAFRGVEKTINRWQPTVDYLNENTPGRLFTLAPLSLVEAETAVKEKTVDFLLTNPGQFVSLESQYHLRPLASLKNKRGEYYLNEFGAVIISRRDDTSIQNIQDLKGKSFGAVSKKAFGGFQMAWRELREHNMDPFTDLKLRFLGFPQDNIVLSVANGSIDAGTVRTDVLERMTAKGKIRMNQFRIIAKKNNDQFPFQLSTRLYPEWPFAALSHIPLETTVLVKETLLNMPATAAASISGKHGGWSDDFDYRRVNELFKVLGIHQYQQNQNSIALSISTGILTLLALLSIGYLLLKHLTPHEYHRNIGIAAIIFFAMIYGLWFVSNQLIADFHNRQFKEAKLLGKSVIEEIVETIRYRTAITQMVGQLFIDRLDQANSEDMLLLSQEIEEYIKPLAPDFMMSAIVHQGKIPKILDESRPIGSVCVNAIRDFSKTSSLHNFENINVHGKPGSFHYDTMVKLGENPSSIFFIGYDLERFTSYLRTIGEFGFEAIVVRQNNPSEIAFSGESIGTHPVYGNRIELDILDRALYEAAIPGTNWRLEILPSNARLSDYKTTLYLGFSAAIGIAVVIFIVSMVRMYKSGIEKKTLLAHANTDPLTGLPNRRAAETYLENVIEQVSAKDTLAALMYLDLDGFKKINDELGHDVGDNVLISVANLLKISVRSNEFVARIGGDEFCVIIPYFEQLEELEKSAKRLLFSVRPESIECEHHVHIGLSIGIAICPKAGTTFKELAVAADKALYKVKTGGKGHYAFSDDI